MKKYAGSFWKNLFYVAALLGGFAYFVLATLEGFGIMFRFFNN